MTSRAAFGNGSWQAPFVTVGMNAGVAYAGMMEVKPDTEQLVDAIYARGGYASRDDVFADAVRLLHERGNVGLPSPGAPEKSMRRRNWAIVAALAQLAITIVALAACAAEIESILFSGPVLTLGGITTAALARPLCSRRVMAYGLSAPLVCVIGAGLISIFQWGPGEAEKPILLLLGIYTAFVAIPAAVVALPAVFQWRVAREARGGVVWQFSLRSLLLVTTGACVLIPVLRYAFADPSPRDLFIFGIFIVVAILLMGISLFVFINDQRRPGRTPSPDKQQASGQTVRQTNQSLIQPETLPAEQHQPDRSEQSFR